MADTYNCTPYWELSNAQRVKINADLARASLADGNIRGCHAECRKCGQKRLVSNPFGARWCRRCQEVFTLEYTVVGEPIAEYVPNEEAVKNDKRKENLLAVFVVALIAAAIGCLCAVCKVRFKFGWMP